MSSTAALTPVGTSANDDDAAPVSEVMTPNVIGVPLPCAGAPHSLPPAPEVVPGAPVVPAAPVVPGAADVPAAVVGAAPAVVPAELPPPLLPHAAATRASTLSAAPFLNHDATESPPLVAGC